MTSDTVSSAMPAPPPTPSPAPPLPSLRIRPREPSDMDALVQLCELQQPTSNYPWCWPPPMPPSEFIERPSELFALVAHHEGKLVGHVAVQRIDRDAEGETWLNGLNIPEGEEHRIASVSVLFLDPTILGSGIGGRLLDAAVALIRHTGRVPVLDVLGKRKAYFIYVSRGFESIGYGTPEWLEGSHITDRVEFFYLPEDAGRQIVSVEVGRVGGKEMHVFGEAFVPVESGLEGQCPRPTMSQGEIDLVACRVLEEGDGPGSKAWLASGGGHLSLLIQKDSGIQQGRRISVSVPSRAVVFSQ